MNKKIIKINVDNTVSTYPVRHTIQQGDVDAYSLEIIFTDLERIEGQVELRFEFPDGQYADREVTLVERNKIIYEMKPEDYSQLGPLRCRVRLMNNNLYTPLLLVFTGIRELVGNVEYTDQIQPYPEWVEEAKREIEDGLDKINHLLGPRTYVHHQPIASNLWIIKHNFGSNPNVTVVDSSGRKVFTQIDYPDPDTVESRSEYEFAGEAYCS